MEPIAVVFVFHAWDTDVCRLLLRSAGNSNGECERGADGPTTLAELA
jgi:hypothetical protein